MQINSPPPKMSITANDKLQQVPRTGKYICYSKLNFHINWSRNKINLILVCPKKVYFNCNECWEIVVQNMYPRHKNPTVNKQRNTQLFNFNI